MQRYIFTEKKRQRGRVLALVLLAGMLVALAIQASPDGPVIPVEDVPQHAGFAGDWQRQFVIGQELALSLDRSMPRGYERIYLWQGGRIVGSLPESPLAQRVRRTLADGGLVRARIAEVDPLDPARGLRIRLLFADRSPGRQSG